MATTKELTKESGLTLPNSSMKMPKLGFGVYSSPTDVCVKSCLTALEAGYRHIDTAQIYGNEAQVGNAITQSKLPRDSLFLTTKMFPLEAPASEVYDRVISSIQKTSGSKDGYVDLFLIHNVRSGERQKILWQALEKAHEEGRAKAIGVSNFGPKQIEAMKQYAKVWPPFVNQIELHPWTQQDYTVDYCKKQGIVVEAYCPIYRNLKAGDKTVARVAEAHGKTANQILIRWSMQKGYVPLPKSDTPSRIKENAEVVGWELSAEEIKQLDGLEMGAKGALVMLASDGGL